MEITTLQKMIEIRAQNRLNNDLAAASEAINKHRVLKRRDEKGFPGLSSSVYVRDSNVPQFDEPMSMSSHLYSSNSPYRKQLYEFWLPTYIQEEIKSFLEEHDMLVGKVSELEQEINDVRDNQQ